MGMKYCPVSGDYFTPSHEIRIPSFTGFEKLFINWTDTVLARSLFIRSHFFCHVAHRLAGGTSISLPLGWMAKTSIFGCGLFRWPAVDSKCRLNMHISWICFCCWFFCGLPWYITMKNHHSGNIFVFPTILSKSKIFKLRMCFFRKEFHSSVVENPKVEKTSSSFARSGERVNIGGVRFVECFVNFLLVLP